MSGAILALRERDCRWLVLPLGSFPDHHSAFALDADPLRAFEPFRLFTSPHSRHRSFPPRGEARLPRALTTGRTSLEDCPAKPVHRTLRPSVGHNCRSDICRNPQQTHTRCPYQRQQPRCRRRSLRNRCSAPSSTDPNFSPILHGVIAESSQSPTLSRIE